MNKTPSGLHRLGGQLASLGRGGCVCGMVSGAPRPITAQQVTVPSHPLGPLLSLDWFSLEAGGQGGGCLPGQGSSAGT